MDGKTKRFDFEGNAKKPTTATVTAVLDSNGICHTQFQIENASIVQLSKMVVHIINHLTAYAADKLADIRGNTSATPPTINGDANANP